MYTVRQGVNLRGLTFIISHYQTKVLTDLVNVLP
jgi:hypothetical protein